MARALNNYLADLAQVVTEYRRLNDIARKALDLAEAPANAPDSKELYRVFDDAVRDRDTAARDVATIAGLVCEATGLIQRRQP